jgi:hypothetical protein
MIQVKDFFFRNAQALILIVAILIWVWANYIYDKEPPVIEIPRAEISHVIFSACLNSEQRLVRAKVEVRNVGLVDITLTKNRHSVATVSPSPAGKEFGDDVRDRGKTNSKPGRIKWPESGASESNSTDEPLQPNKIHVQYHDFVISPSLKVIEVTSTFEDTSSIGDEKKPSWEGGEVKTIYNVGDPACTKLVGNEASDS